MNTILDAIRAQRDVLEAERDVVLGKLEALDEMQRLAVALNGVALARAPVTVMAPAAAAEPAGAPSRRAARQPVRDPSTNQILRADTRRARILAVYRGHAGEWLAASFVADEARDRADYVAEAAKVFVADGRLEHNGKPRSQSRFRAPKSAAAATMLPVPERPAAARRAARQTGEPDVAAAAARAASAKHDTEAGTLQGRVVAHTQAKPSTLPEISAALRVEREDVAAVARKLEEDGDLERVGRRGGEVVYRGRV